jgi:hypothetical protein
MTIERYPLTWPAGQPRTPYHRRADAAFKVDFTRARDELLHSIQLLGGRNVILSSNIALRQDGLPYANMPEPQDPGIAAYFDRSVKNADARFETRPFVIACDTYRKAKWNLRAIGATVEALRSIQRHGASSMLEQAFTGFAALPPKREMSAPWWETLGLPADADRDAIRKRYIELVQENHPDRGGDGARMAAINVAFQQSGVAQ